MHLGCKQEDTPIKSDEKKYRFNKVYREPKIFKLMKVYFCELHRPFEPKMLPPQ